ncbi:unnamed protein product [Adineta ricciae]|uniref:EXPERA domain-containing protein n=1 Tax=Adineta ricciae TaxID=249248 RepID=A0A814VY76_ADIRI|nr:unnamed protein product [Adineta ricciae]
MSADNQTYPLPSETVLVLHVIQHYFVDQLPLVITILGLLGFIGNCFTFLQPVLRRTSFCIYTLCGSCVDIINIFANLFPNYLNPLVEDLTPSKSNRLRCKLKIFSLVFLPQLSMNLLIMSLIDRLVCTYSPACRVRFLLQSKMVPWLIGITVIISSIMSSYAPILNDIIPEIGCNTTNALSNSAWYISIHGILTPLIMLVLVSLTHRRFSQSRQRVMEISKTKRRHFRNQFVTMVFAQILFCLPQHKDVDIEQSQLTRMSRRKNTKLPTGTDGKASVTNELSAKSKPLVKSVDVESPPTRVLCGIIGVSFLSVPICYILSYMKEMKDSLNVFLYSAAICIAVAPLTYFLLIKHLLHVKKEMYFYVFTIFSFTAIADLLLALTIDGYSSAFLFYLEQGEVYLKTGHGLFINYWDGTTHFLLYLVMIYCMLKQQTKTKFFRFLSLFWCGSIINSLIVLVGGAAVGQFGSHIKPSCLLNVPYMMFPLIFLLRQCHSRQTFIQQQNKENRKASSRKPLNARPLDILFIGYFIFAILFAIFRVLHALKTPLTKNSFYYDYEPYILNKSGFPTVQLLTYGFYFVAYYYLAINALIFYDQQPSQYNWFPDWTMVHAGAAAQAQFSYLLSSLHDPPLFPEPSWAAIPPNNWWISVGLNLILAIVPQLLAFRVCTGKRDREFY